MTTKKNIPLILGFSIPVLMVIFVAASIYIPGLFNHPKINFLYSADRNYYNSRSYSVSNDHLIENPQPILTYSDSIPYVSPQLYVHNVTTNMSTPISFQEAANLILDPSIESPDGYKLENGSNGGGFFPFSGYSGDYNAQYIIGHNMSKKLNVKNNSSYNTIHFLGWIIQ